MNPAAGITFAYNRIALRAVFVLFVLFIVFMIFEYNRYRDHEINIAASELRESASSIEVELSLASGDVEQMRGLAEDLMAITEATSLELPLNNYIETAGGGTFFSMDNHPPEYTGSYGNLFGIGDFKQRDDTFYREINVALWLSELLKNTHANNPVFESSYYLSKKEFAITYPWTDIDYMIGRGANNNVNDVFDAFYEGDEWRHLLPENNPQRENKWVDVYLDDADRLMATNVSPVYYRDQFLGIIASNIKLAFIDDALEKAAGSGDSLLIVTAGERAIAQKPAHETHREIPTLEKTLPESLSDISDQLFDTPSGQNLSINGYNVISVSLETPRWTVIEIIPEKSIIASFIPKSWYIIAAFVVVIIALTANYFIARVFIRPFTTTEGIPGNPIQGNRIRHSDMNSVLKEWTRFVTEAIHMKAASTNMPGVIFQAVMAPDKKIRFIFVSEKIGQMLNIEDIESLRKKRSDFRFIPDKERQVFQEKLYTSAHTMDTFEHVCRIENAKDASSCIHFIAKPRRGQQSEIIWDGLILDITESIEAEEVLKGHRNKLEELVEERTRELRAANRELEIEIAQRRKNDIKQKQG